MLPGFRIPCGYVSDGKRFAEQDYATFIVILCFPCSQIAKNRRRAHFWHFLVIFWQFDRVNYGFESKFLNHLVRRNKLKTNCLLRFSLKSESSTSPKPPKIGYFWPKNSSLTSIGPFEQTLKWADRSKATKTGFFGVLIGPGKLILNFSKPL